MFAQAQSRPEAGSNVCAIAVTYHPDIEVFQRLTQAVIHQVRILVIVDNGSNASALESLRDLAASDSRIVLIELGSNLGLGAAHNAGIEICRSRGCPYILLLDQDSEPASDMVAQLLFAHQDLSQTKRIAAVGPRYVDPTSQHWSRFVRFGLLRFQSIPCSETNSMPAADFLISSGSLISIAALDTIGRMDEALFVDHIDTEWCLRARQHGWHIHGVCAATMYHSLGDDGIHIKLLRSRRIAVHSPLRHYYVYRNSIALMLRPYVPIKWRINDGYRLLGMLVIFMLLAPRRIERLGNILLGLYHGFRGRLGPKNSGT
ncbi:MAG: glycosyltransferase family 2 protein [Proteobacteria bacterium]|nr:glycosyltransferase family 2 protein [Pseudomonadota bacterium]